MSALFLEHVRDLLLCGIYTTISRALGPKFQTVVSTPITSQRIIYTLGDVQKKVKRVEQQNSPEK